MAVTARIMICVGVMTAPPMLTGVLEGFAQNLLSDETLAVRTMARARIEALRQIREMIEGLFAEEMTEVSRRLTSNVEASLKETPVEGASGVVDVDARPVVPPDLLED
jgi:predicted RNA-binding Zn ribbon-like protein